MLDLRLAMAVTVLCLPCVSGCAEDDSYYPSPDSGRAFPDRFLQVPLTASEMPMASELLDFIEVSRFGSLEGAADSPALGEIGDVAVSSDSVLAVSDVLSCSIHRFELGTGAYLGELGGCGDGPEEFRQPAALAYQHDTLIAIDFQRRRTVAIAPDGAWESEPWPSVWIGSLAFFGVDFSGSRKLRLPAWLPGEGDGVTHQLFEDGELVREASLVSDAFAGLLDAIVHNVASCILPTSGEILHANSTERELHLLDERLAPVAFFRDPEPWPEPIEDSSFPGGWVPGHVAMVSVACGDDVGLARWFTQSLNEPGEMPSLERVILVAVTSDGEVVHRADRARPSFPDILTLRPGAAIGDLFVFHQNNLGPYPSVHVYRASVSDVP